MAIRGLPQDFLIAFIPESEKNLDNEKDRTIFHISPKDARAANKALAMMSNTIKQKRSGVSKIDAHKFGAAELDLWLDMIDHIDNFIFSDGSDKGKITRKVEGGDMIGKVYHQLPSSIIQEVFDASEDFTILDDAQKKDLTS